MTPLAIAVSALAVACVWLAVTIWNLTRLIALVLQALSQQYGTHTDQRNG